AACWVPAARTDVPVRRVAALAAAVATLVVLAGPASGADTPSPAAPRLTTVVPNADFPTNLAFAPDGRMFFTEKETGNIRVVEDGKLLAEPFATLPVQDGGESGLLGLVLDPDFASSPYVYVYSTSSGDGKNHVARIRASDTDPNKGGSPENLLTL